MTTVQERFVYFRIKLQLDTSTGKVVNVEQLDHPSQQPVKKIKDDRLISFIEERNPSEVEKLLKANCDPNIVSKRGQSCLEVALDSNNFEIFKMLMEAGADINTKVTNYKMSLLNCACWKYNKEIVEYLLEKKVDINEPDIDNDTPLHNSFRSINFNIEIVKMLLANGADCTKKNNSGLTPLEQAKKFGKRDVIKLIEDHLNSKNTENATVLVEVGASSAEEKPVKKIKNLDLFNHIEQNNITALEQMLIEGADPNTNENPSTTPLCCAIYYDNLKMVKMLVKYGANLEAKSRIFGNITPLNYACYEKHREIFEFLFESGAKIDCCDEFGDNPLHNFIRNNYSCKASNLEFAKSLLEKGAKYDQKNGSGFTPLEFVKLNKLTEFIKVIEDFIDSKKVHTVETLNSKSTSIKLVINGMEVTIEGSKESCEKFRESFQ